MDAIVFAIVPAGNGVIYARMITERTEKLRPAGVYATGFGVSDSINLKTLFLFYRFGKIGLILRNITRWFRRMSIPVAG
jgi:hypothetical protein